MVKVCNQITSNARRVKAELLCRETPVTCRPVIVTCRPVLLLLSAGRAPNMSLLFPKRKSFM